MTALFARVLYVYVLWWNTTRHIYSTRNVPKAVWACVVWRILRWILRNVLNSLAFKLFGYTAAEAAAALYTMTVVAVMMVPLWFLTLILTHSLVHMHSRQTAQFHCHKAE